MSDSKPCGEVIKRDRIHRREYFVSFEAPNGVGKSSLLDGAANQLTRLNFDIFKTKEPTLSALGQFVRAAEENHQGRTLACLVVADRYFQIENEVYQHFKRVKLFSLPDMLNRHLYCKDLMV